MIGTSSRTKYFSMEDGASRDISCEQRAGVEDGSCGVPEAGGDVPVGSWRRELEMSKVQFEQTIRRQHEVEQSVSSLLTRLAELGDESRVEATPVTPVKKENHVAMEQMKEKLVAQRLRLPEQGRDVAPNGEAAGAVAARVAAASAAKSDPLRPAVPEPVGSRSPVTPLLPSSQKRFGLLEPAISAANNALQSAQLQQGVQQAPPLCSGRSVPAPVEAEEEIQSPTKLPGKAWNLGESAEQEAPCGDVAEYSDEIHSAEAGPASARGPSPLREAAPTAAVTTPLPVIQLGQGGAVGDQSLLPRRSSGGDADTWRGWTIETSNDGRLFFYHAASETSQWQMPPELTPVLGEWEFVTDTNADPADAGDQSYWRNELLGVSAWKDPRHTTNLLQAALDGNLFFLQLYTEVGGFLDAVDTKGRSALHYNCAGGSAQAVLYLLQNKASPDLPDQGGSIPLHWACRYGHDTIVRILLEAKANPDRQNDLGDTAVHEAAALSRVTALQWLVLSRANLSLRNRESRTPAEVALRSRSREAAELLRHHEKLQRRNSRQAMETQSEDDSENQIGLPQVSRSSASHARRNPRSQMPPHASDSGTDSETDEPDPSLALVIVRAARPLLRGVQWLANRVLGERKAPLGVNNTYTYDTQSNQWVEQRPEDASRQHWEAQAGTAPSDDSDDSAVSEEEERALPSPPSAFQALRKIRLRGPSQEADGLP